MSEERINALLAELRAELQDTPAVDAQTVAAVEKLGADIERQLSAQDLTTESVLDDAIALEAGFAARHPVAERILRELIETLSKLGI